MSKIGKRSIKIKDNISLEEKEKSWIVTGPNGSLEVDKVPGVSIVVVDGEIKVSLADVSAQNGKAYWGLIRSLINNAVIGVSDGFTKELELVGVGYRAEKIGNDIKLAIGYSHPVIVKAPEGISLELEGNTVIRVKGMNKQIVGQTAANIRAIRKPEPYKGKGIKYKDEIVRRKQGKAAK